MARTRKPMSEETKAKIAASRKAKQVSGLGDVVEQITTVIGMKAIVKAVVGDDCGCNERKQKLNALFPLGKRIYNCTTDEQITYLKNYFESGKKTIAFSERLELIKIYNHAFNIQISEEDNCSSCWRDYLKDLKRLIDLHND